MTSPKKPAADERPSPVPRGRNRSLAGALTARTPRPAAVRGATPSPRPPAVPKQSGAPKAALTPPVGPPLALGSLQPAPPAPGGQPLQELRLAIRTGVVKELGPRFGKVTDEAKLRELLSKHLDVELAKSPVSVAPSEREHFISSTLADMIGWGVLTELMDDPTVTEVMCNGPYDVYVERDGMVAPAGVQFSDAGALRQVIDRMLGLCGRRVDEASPMADGRLADGSRINAIIPPLSMVGPVLTVRRFPETAFTVADLIARDSLTTEAAVFLEACVRGKLNILISGGTATGKTTLLSVVSAFIPPNERIITIEDSAELRLPQPHVVGLESRPANIEGAGLISIRDLVRNALRMRPDRIVVGEVRGGEALDMLQAMNTGHEGSLTTVHANASRDALLRLETMVLMSGVDLPLRAIREQVASAFDLIVQLERRPDGHRVVANICEVQGREGDTITLQDVFTRTGTQPLRATGLRPLLLDKLAVRDVTVPVHILRAPTGPVAAGARAGRTR